MSEGNRFYTAEEIRRCLSISTLVFLKYRPIGEGALGELARHGIRRIELMESREQFDMAGARSMKLIGEVCRSCGVEIAAYHAWETNFSDLDTETKRRKRVDFCRRQIDTMLDLGGTVWGSHARVERTVIGSDAREAQACVLIKCYEELARHAEGTAATLALENFGGPEDQMAILDRIDHPQVGLILDIGHVRDSDAVNLMTLPGGPTRVLEMCGRRLCHTHLHGYVSDQLHRPFVYGLDHFPPLVPGDRIQWVELFRMLRTIGYSGDMNFEPVGPPKNLHSLEAVAAAPERIVEMEAKTP